MNRSISDGAHSAFIEKLDTLCVLIEKSDNSIYASSTTSEMIDALQNIKNDFLKTGSFDREKLFSLLAPTSSIQEISIANGWGEKFLKFAQEIDVLSNQLPKEGNHVQRTKRP